MANVVVIDFTAEAGTQVSATVERGLSATGPWTFLTTVDLLGEQAVVYDNTAPLDVEVWYRATADDATVEVYGPFTQVSDGNVFLRDPLRPWADLEFTFCSTQQGLKREMCLPSGPEFVWLGLGEKVRSMDAGLFPRLDAETPADVFARRKNLRGSMSFMTKTLAAAEAVYTLFTAGGPLFLQLPTVYGWKDAYLQPGDLTETYLYPDQRMPHRVWTVPFELVDATTGPTQGIECATWCDVEETFPTFADMTASGGTWLDVAQGELVCPGGEPVEAFTDTFSRVVANGWGTADTGQVWTVAQGAASSFSVDGSAGVDTHTVTGGTHLISAPYSSPDVNAVLDFSMDQVNTGDTVLLFLTARTVDTANFYSARISFAAGGAMSISVRKRIANVDTSLNSIATGLTYTAGKVYRMRFVVQGSTLSARVWDPLLAEPGTFQVTAVDTDLTAAGAIGIRTLVNAITNPLPFILRFQNLAVTP